MSESVESQSIARPVIGVGVLVWQGKKLLLGKRILKDQTCWQFPGGHLENGESVIECARREVQEETSLRVDALRHHGFADESFLVGKKKYQTLFVSCDYQSGEAQAMEPEKCACWQWFDYQQLPEPLFKPIGLYLAQITHCEQSDLHALHEAATPFPDTLAGEHK